MITASDTRRRSCASGLCLKRQTESAIAPTFTLRPIANAAKNIVGCVASHATSGASRSTPATNSPDVRHDANIGAAVRNGRAYSHGWRTSSADLRGKYAMANAMTGNAIGEAIHENTVITWRMPMGSTDSAPSSTPPAADPANTNDAMASRAERSRGRSTSSTTLHVMKIVS